jgi:hypothetical protein
MTEQTKDQLEKLGMITLINTGAFIFTKYFILPDTGMLMKINGEWETSQTIFPYTSDMSFAEWPSPMQQGFLAFMFGTLLGFFILFPILGMIFDFMVDRIKRLF